MDEQALLEIFSREIVPGLAGRLEFGPRAANRLERTIADAARSAAYDSCIADEAAAVRHARQFVEAFLAQIEESQGQTTVIKINDAAYTTAILAFCPMWPWRL